MSTSRQGISPPRETTVEILEMQPGNGTSSPQDDEIGDEVEQGGHLSSTESEGAPSIDYRRTDLHTAALQGHVQDVERILRQFPKSSTIESRVKVVNAKDNYGYTPLHLAVREQQEDVVRILTESSLVLPDRFLAATSEVVDETEKECDGFTPLHMAVAAQQAVGTSRQRLLIVKLLLRRPACLGDQYGGYDPVNLRATTGKGLCPLDIAKQRRHGELVEFLECYDYEWLQSERAKCANSMNAALVGAALIVAASFATWLQPPLGFPNETSNPVTKDQSYGSALFFLSVAMAFFYSLAALLCGTFAMIPSDARCGLKSEVRKLQGYLRLVSTLLLAAINFFCLAFVAVSKLVLFKVVFVSRALSAILLGLNVVLTTFCYFFTFHLIFERL